MAKINEMGSLTAPIRSWQGVSNLQSVPNPQTTQYFRYCMPEPEEHAIHRPGPLYHAYIREHLRTLEAHHLFEPQNVLKAEPNSTPRSPSCSSLNKPTNLNQVRTQTPNNFVTSSQAHLQHILLSQPVEESREQLNEQILNEQILNEQILNEPQSLKQNHFDAQISQLSSLQSSLQSSQKFSLQSSLQPSCQSSFESSPQQSPPLSTTGSLRLSTHSAFKNCSKYDLSKHCETTKSLNPVNLRRAATFDYLNNINLLEKANYLSASSVTLNTMGKRDRVPETPEPNRLRHLLATNPHECILHLSSASDELGFNLSSKKRPILAHLIVKVSSHLAAARAGVREGDQLLAVDGVDCRSIDHQQVVKLLKQRGSHLRLLVCNPLLYRWAVGNSMHLELNTSAPYFAPTNASPTELHEILCPPARTLDEPDFEKTVERMHIPYVDYDPEVREPPSRVKRIDNQENRAPKFSNTPSGTKETVTKTRSQPYQTSKSIHMNNAEPRLHLPATLNSKEVNFSNIHEYMDEDTSTNGSLSAYGEKYPEASFGFDRGSSLRRSELSDYSYEAKSMEFNEYRRGPTQSTQSMHKQLYTREITMPSGRTGGITRESYEDEQMRTTRPVGSTYLRSQGRPSSALSSSSSSSQSNAIRANNSSMSKSYTHLSSRRELPVDVPYELQYPTSSRTVGSTGDLRTRTLEKRPLPTLVERASVGSLDSRAPVNEERILPIKAQPKDSLNVSKALDRKAAPVPAFHSPLPREPLDINELPSPRLCNLRLPDNGICNFGFTVKTCKKTNVKSIIEVAKDSIAFKAGLRSNDVLIEVNGVNVGIDNHRQVTERIKSLSSDEIQLLVLTEIEYEVYKKKNVVPKSTQENVICLQNFPQLASAEHVHLPDNKGVENKKVATPERGFWGSIFGNLTAKQYRNYLQHKQKPDPRCSSVDIQDKIKYFEKL